MCLKKWRTSPRSPIKVPIYPSFPSSSLGTLLAGEALLRHLIAPRPHEKPLYHQRTRRPLLRHLHGGPMDSPLHPDFDIIDSLQFCRQHKVLKIHAYVILDNHLHLVAAGENLTDIIRDYKSYTARLLIARLEQDQKTWVLNQFQYYKQPTKTKSDLSGLAGRVSPPADRLRGDAASEGRLSASQSGAHRGGGAAGRLGLLQRQGLCRGEGPD